MSDNLKVIPISDEYRQNLECVNFDGERFRGVGPRGKGQQKYIECDKCSYVRVALIEVCPVCKKR